MIAFLLLLSCSRRSYQPLGWLDWFSAVAMPAANCFNDLWLSVRPGEALAWAKRDSRLTPDHPVLRQELGNALHDLALLSKFMLLQSLRYHYALVQPAGPSVHASPDGPLASCLVLGLSIWPGL